jgi:methylated-DNA-[protein]-cysteine S-methyltransferase
MKYTTVQSPIGELLLVGDQRGLARLSMSPFWIDRDWEPDAAHFDDVREQLSEYFAAERHEFELELALDGNPFELTVWSALLEIPYGETASYGEVALRIGKPSAPRAVGLANGRNPVALVVPCHRVIGSNGSLTGYGGGLERKRFLLDLEAGVQSLNA